MSLQVEEKHILPGFVLDRTRFDLAQVDSASGKRLKHAMKNPRLISHRKDQRSFVILARRRILIPDSQKARNIIALIFNVAGYDLEIINFFRQTTGDRAKRCVLCRHFRSMGGAGTSSTETFGKWRPSQPRH